MKSHACDLCSEESAVEVPFCRLYTNDQPIHICKGCGFVHVKNRRSAEEIAAAWSDELYGSGYTARIPAVAARQTYVAAFTDLHLKLKGKTLCDIGTGEGQFLEIVRDQFNAKVFGTEASKRNCDLLRAQKIDCFQGTIEEYAASKEFNPGSADVATIMWTVENCTSCRDMLNSAYDILKENGSVVIATGSRILVPFKKPLYEYLTPNQADTHCFRFSANTITGLLAETGFRVTQINSYIDSDILCVIGQKTDRQDKIAWQGDNYLQVYDFFTRWHHETAYYPRGGAGRISRQWA